MRYKILMMPSWYPTNDDPIGGSFFKEQAEILSEKFDIIVVCVKENNSRNRKKMHQIWKKNTKSTLVEYLHEYNSSKIEKIIRYIVKKDIFKNVFIGNLFDYFDSLYDKKKLNFYLKIVNFLKIEHDFEPDLIYSMIIQHNSYDTYMLSKKIKIPLIVAEHNPFPFPGSLIEKKVKHAMENCSAILSVSNHLTRMMLMQNINCNPHIIGNVINEGKFLLKPDKNKKDNRILIVGAYNFFKDYLTFFKAIKYFQEISTQKIKVTVVGYQFSKSYSQGEDQFKDLINSLNIQDCIELVPYASREDIIEYYYKSDIFVSTSVQETFGMSCLEAMACGVPVFATRSGGVEDFVNDKVGRLFNLQDYKSIAEELKRFFDDEIVFSAEEIRKYAVNNFGIDVFISKFYDVFLNCLNNFQNIEIN